MLTKSEFQGAPERRMPLEESGNWWRSQETLPGGFKNLGFDADD